MTTQDIAPLVVDRRPVCTACGERIDGTIVPARITDDDLIIHFHFECEPDD